ncbi:type II toxin-antitoxin system PemK/MazF family toxin [Subtercola endophyticus]|uniref:type II toxin-antitoxin system PemK/MazF family toxin n=1 Tax=Subtercola endophyticus TaxID=2895559 RepID=UPI001E5A4B57|nr:type II toxin-antitoxin system PemK/MazF family toxin [Subtercola endophyticus]UFS58908.1 type II toxin-antitoxin system PemK/MazF family toxin [Subtercola endophyticus]
MRRGHVVAVRLDPAEPGEAAKTRPCLVVSNDGANESATSVGRGTITIVPVTTNVSNAHGEFQVLVDDAEVLESMGLSSTSKIQAEQVRTVSVERLSGIRGYAPGWIMQQVDHALRFHLSL